MHAGKEGGPLHPLQRCIQHRWLWSWGDAGSQGTQRRDMASAYRLVVGQWEMRSNPRFWSGAPEGLGVLLTNMGTALSLWRIKITHPIIFA